MRDSCISVGEIGQNKCVLARIRLKHVWQKMVIQFSSFERKFFVLVSAFVGKIVLTIIYC